MVSRDYEVSYLRVGVSDLDTAQQFYEGILGMQMVVARDEDGYLLFGLGCTTLIVETATAIEGEKQPKLSIGRYLGISLKIRNIHQFYETAQNQGAKFTHPPEKQFWGGYLAEIADPDGNIWTLVE
jgi:catechol 2,3-dioxygenase-like lactoylglutathione lyase family enzyme